jgi:hypothetical protein
MPLLIKRAIIGMKTEAVAGTAEVLANGDADLNCYYEPGAFVWDIPMTDREAQLTFNKNPSVGGARGARMRFEVDLHSSGSSADPGTELSSLLKACGYTQATGVFTPTSSPASMTTVTLGHYLDGKVKYLVGGMGNVGMRFRHGQIARWIFDFTGKYGGEADATLLTYTPPTVIPPRIANSLSFNGITTALTDEVVFDKGNNVKLREVMTDVTGWHSAIITNDKPTVTMSPEAVLVATHALDTALLTPSEFAMTMQWGATANNILTIAAAGSKAQFASRAEAAREGLAVDSVTININQGLLLTFS